MVIRERREKCGQLLLEKRIDFPIIDSVRLIHVVAYSWQTYVNVQHPWLQSKWTKWTVRHTQDNHI